MNALQALAYKKPRILQDTAAPFPMSRNNYNQTVVSILKRWLYFIRYGLECFVLGKRKPIAGGVPLTDRCNLSCKHCVVKDGTIGHHSFDTICAWIDKLYKAGARFLYLQGGEILLWREGEYGPNDVIREARRRGFFSVSCVTNGTLPIELEADSIWVSVDGPEAIHDSIRGEGAFSRMIENLSASRHPRIYANITLNRINVRHLEETISAIRRIPQFHGISVNFHTPYSGVEGLAIPRVERMVVVQKLIDMKKAKYPILNSVAGLRNLARGNCKPTWMIRMYEQGRVFDCCWGREQDGLCSDCGYGIISELRAITSLRPSAIISAFRLF
jgi:MoaA/NifB/PqqE/SkfB family radical SAM enzyme